MGLTSRKQAEMWKKMGQHATGIYNIVTTTDFLKHTMSYFNRKLKYF